MLIWGQKMTNLPNFGDKKKFPQKSKTITFTHSSMPDIVKFQENLENKFREKVKNKNFWPKYTTFTPIYSITEIKEVIRINIKYIRMTSTFLCSTFLFLLLLDPSF